MYKLSVPAVALVATMIALLIPAPALAVSIEPEVKVGEVYVVSTITGVAKAYIGGREVTLPAILEMRCRVTEVGARFVLFRVAGGTLRLGETAYNIVDGWWRGIYDKKTERSLVEITAVDGTDGRIHVILTGDDARHTPGGTFMVIIGFLKDHDNVYWRLRIMAWRFRLT
ncbi:hypothetical protein KEJ51_07845 [Candidatus Bathyarchaeota archaeon]|nr:hypothetical protein [Candidatus Bathyarchaeota archaeon]